MNMVSHQAPCERFRFIGRQRMLEKGEELVSVLVAFEDKLLARSTGNDMIDVQLTWYSTLAHVLSKSNGGI